MLRIVTTCVGSFVLDNSNVVDKILFNHADDVMHKQNYEKQLSAKHPPAELVQGISVFPKIPEYFESFYQRNIEVTQQSLKESVKKDGLIIHQVHIIEDCDKVANILSKRLRDILRIYLPVFEHEVTDNKTCAEMIVQQKHSELKQKYPSVMNSDLSQNDWQVVVHFAQSVYSIFKLKETTLETLEKTMQDYVPNTVQVAGVFIGAKLIELAGSLVKLAEMRSSTLQVLGAEKAMFRHLTTKARCPKHGIILNHSLMLKNKEALHGRIARHLASAITKAVRVDFFKGDPYLGYQLREGLEKLFGGKS